MSSDLRVELEPPYSRLRDRPSGLRDLDRERRCPLIGPSPEAKKLLICFHSKSNSVKDIFHSFSFVEISGTDLSTIFSDLSQIFRQFRCDDKMNHMHVPQTVWKGL